MHKKTTQAFEVEHNVLESCSSNPQDDRNKLMTVNYSWVDTMPSDVTWDIAIAAVESTQFLTMLCLLL